MATLRQIRRRIRSVQGIQRVTRAMKMMATARLRRAQEAVQAARPYAENLQRLLGLLIRQVEDYRHPLLEQREPNRNVLIVITADRGLCGAFNANAIRTATERLRQLPEGTPLICLGARGANHFERRGFPVLASYRDVFQRLRIEQARVVARDLVARYSRAEVDRVEVVFNEFRSMLHQVPVVETLLPISWETGAQETPLDPALYLYEPNRAAILDQLLPYYVETILWRMMLESNASEQAARMNAMENATKNADEMIEQLILQRNRVRQTMITKEIAEIVGGAEALKATT
ncbi:MAG: ATP synthase gamma chain [Candidatus Poribacteria bacterium]|nr:MAG: ATP synthase gamma chain [Candidatus Poribacteria bacterium]